jgi:hypothetical protein
MLYRMLEQRLPDMLTQEFRELKYENGTLLNVAFDLEAGAQKLIVDVMTQVGTADLIGDATGDFPIVDVNLEEDDYRIFAWGAAMSYTFRQMQRESFANRFAQLNATREDTVMRAIAERVNKFTAFGDTRVNVTGFLNSPLVSSTNSTFDFHATGSAAKTFQELYGFLIDLVESFYTGSNNVAMPTTWAVSTEEWFKITKVVTSNDGANYAPAAANLKSYLETALSDELGAPFRIIHSPEALAANVATAGAGVANKNRTVLYVNDPRTVTIHREPVSMLPQEFVAPKDGRMVFPFMAAASEVVIHKPLQMRYIDIINKATAASS